MNTNKNSEARRNLGEIVDAPTPNAALTAEAEKNDAEVTSYDPRRLEQFLTGQITLGDLEEIPKDAQYGMAETGYNLLTEGKLEAANRVFEGLHALDPFDAYFLMALGSIAQQKGELDEAETRYSRALEINPYSIPARAHRGEVRILMGKLPLAVEDLVRVAADDPEGNDPATKRAAALAQVVRKQLEEKSQSIGNG